MKHVGGCRVSCLWFESFTADRYSSFVNRRGIGKNTKVPITLEPSCPLIVVIGASAGGLEPLRRIIAVLPMPCPASIFIVMHIGGYPSVLPSLLDRPGFPAAFAQEGTLIEAGHIYVAPPDRHMLLDRYSIRLSHGPKVHHARPAVDPLFMSAAEIHGNQVLGIILSGGDGDGAAGLRAIKTQGGMTLVQLPEDAVDPSMPRAAIRAKHPDDCLPVEVIAQRVGIFCSSPRSSPLNVCL
jgi:two-component system, chemotaxis family, protein-glutamate methylesterase/glutaminase